MIGIIGAMDCEVDGLKQIMQDIEISCISGVSFYKGLINDALVVVAKAGVGKVNAAVTTQTMILKYNVDAVINIGVAGGIEKSLKIGDVVVADKVVEHDMDTTAIGEPAGFIGGLDRVYIEADKGIAKKLIDAANKNEIHAISGTIASGDIFVAEQSVRDRIFVLFGGYAAEMEGASVGHVCAMNNVPFGVLRAISDGANCDSKMDFPTFAVMAAKNSIEIIKAFLEE